MEQKQHNLGALAEIGACLLFGGSFLFTRIAMAEASSFTMLGWRFLAAVITLTLLAAARVIKLDLRGKDLRPVIAMSLCEPVLYFIGESNGIALTTTAESGTLIACIPLATLLFARLILRERPTRAQRLGILISVAGVILVGLSKGLSASFSIKGYAFLLLAVVAGSLFTVFARRATGFTSAEKTYVMACIGLFVFGGGTVIEHAAGGTLRALAMLPFTSLPFALSILYLSLGCQVLAFLLNHYAITAIGPIQANSFIGLITVISILLGVLALHEDFTPLQGVGSLLVLLGVYAANLPFKRTRDAQKEAVKHA